MSVVGPRPALPNEVATYNDYQRQRLLVKPGRTCYWQLRRNCGSSTFDEWVDLDLWRRAAEGGPSERRIGTIRGSSLLPNPESKRPCYAASTFSASSKLAEIIFLAASARSAAGLPAPSGPFFRFSSYSSWILPYAK